MQNFIHVPKTKPRTVSVTTLFMVAISHWICFSQGTITVTFDGEPAPLPGQRYIVSPNYQESGMGFYSGGDGHGNYGVTRAAADYRSGFPYNGTLYLQNLAFGYGPIYCTARQGTFGPLPPFGVYSIDLAGYSEEIPDFDVVFFAARSDGALLTTEFSGTGLDFQTFEFDPGWRSGLSFLEISMRYPTGWSADNLVVIIPEPATGGLFALGALTLAFWRCRRSKTGA